MGLTLVTPPALEPITLAEAKDYLGVSDSEFDAKIAGFILAARHWAEGYTHRALMRQTWDYTLHYNWPCTIIGGYYRTRIELPLPPHIRYLNTVSSPQAIVDPVTSITYVDGSGNNQTLAANQYVVRTGGPFGYVEPAYGVSWPDVRFQTHAITVRMVCGYGENPGDVPEDLRHAMLIHVGMLMDCDPRSADIHEHARDSLISGNQAIRL